MAKAWQQPGVVVAHASDLEAQQRSIRVLQYGVFVLVSLILTGLLYGLIAGLFNPPAPRSSAEAQLTVLRTAIETNPESARAWTDYAKVLASTGRTAEARKVIKDGRAAAETSATAAFFSLAEGYVGYATEDFDATIKAAKKSIELDEAAKTAKSKDLASKGIVPRKGDWPNDVYIEANLLVAQVLTDRRDWKGLVAVYSDILERSPMEASVLSARAEAYRELGQTADAKADFEKALMYIPDYARATQGLKALESADSKGGK